MSKNKIFSPSALALDRVLLYGGPQAVLAADESIHSKSDLALGLDIARQFSELAKYSKPAKDLMDGGLMFHLKMECVLRQKKQQRGVNRQDDK